MSAPELAARRIAVRAVREALQNDAWPRRGALTPGALADLVIWDADLHRTKASELHRVAPAFTLLDGVVRFERAGSGESVAAGNRREDA